MADERSFLFPGEQERIDAALKALDQDPHAPREISVRVGLRKHNEYPKMLYRGKRTLMVQSEQEEQQAFERGFGVSAPKPPQAEDDQYDAPFAADAPAEAQEEE